MILELKNIYKEYIQGKMSVPVLKNVDFSMEEGEYVAIMGPSGSGKTTLMSIIGCLDQPTQGQFFLDGRRYVNAPRIRCLISGCVRSDLYFRASICFPDSQHLPM